MSIPLLGLSDPLGEPTGFARVARNVLLSLPERIDLYYAAPHWAGSIKFPRAKTLTSRFSYGIPNYGQLGVVDFAQEYGQPFILWTLMDLWQTNWLTHDRSTLLDRETAQFVVDQRKQFAWVGYFPLDGDGNTSKRIPLHFEEYVDGMDYPVAMSRFGQRLLQPHVKKEIRFIPHGVAEEFHPGDRADARMNIEAAYLEVLGQMFPDTGIMDRRLILGDRPVVLCVMANRRRKYWPTVLRAFKAFLEDYPSAILIAVCGDRKGQSNDTWPLEVLCLDLELRLDYLSKTHPNVWLLQTVGASLEMADQALAMLYRAADFTLLIGGGEGSGMPQLEAHACGRACLIGHYSASIEQGVDESEFIWPRGFYEETVNLTRRPIYTVGDVYEKMKYAMKNKAWREDVGAAGAAQGASLRWTSLLPQWVSLFEEAYHGLVPASPRADTQAVPV